jgi:hypothetical protein
MRRAHQCACRRCGTTFTARERAWAYCPAYRTETRPCAECGRPVTHDRGRDRAYFRNRLWFCDRRCFGRWAGRLHGFAAHPDHVFDRARRVRQTIPTVRRHCTAPVLILPGALAA